MEAVPAKRSAFVIYNASFSIGCTVCSNLNQFATFAIFRLALKDGLFLGKDTVASSTPAPPPASTKKHRPV